MVMKEHPIVTPEELRALMSPDKRTPNLPLDEPPQQTTNHNEALAMVSLIAQLHHTVNTLHNKVDRLERLLQSHDPDKESSESPHKEHKQTAGVEPADQTRTVTGSRTEEKITPEPAAAASAPTDGRSGDKDASLGQTAPQQTRLERYRQKKKGLFRFFK